LSARAAWRLASLGFSRVYRYPPGTSGWLAFGLPTEGTEAGAPRAGDIVRRDVPTCALHDRLGDVRGRIQAAGWTNCIVVDDRGVILGRVRGKTLASDPAQTVEAVMEAGPTTVHPSEPLAALIGRMKKRKVSAIVVSTPDGVLVGVLRREDGERRLAAETAARASGACA
jgi:CBS domain-containing protein